MSQWKTAPVGVKAPPQTQNVQELRDYVKTLADIVAIIAKDMNFIINGNVDGDNIRANSIETKNLKAGSITSDKIDAGAVTADKIDVNELSAISADLGTITAGSITTNAEINVGTDAIVGNNLYVGDTSTAIDRVITLKEHFLKTTDSGANLQLFGAIALLLWGFDDVEVRASFGDILLNAAGDYYLDSITSGNKIARQSQIDSLQSSKQNVISGATGVFYVSPTLGGSPTTAVTVFNGVVALIVP